MKFSYLLLLLLFAMYLSSCNQQYTPQTGDLLFMDLDCGSFCQAIKKVTYGVNGTKPSHVGMVYINDKKKIYVIEADTKGVVKTPIDSFLKRSLDTKGHPKVFVGRLIKEYSYAIVPAVQRSRAFLGKPYDFAFDINNDCYYCSELLYKAFLDKKGDSLFNLDPMTFDDPDTKTIFPIWEDYFKKLGIPVPEGKPGLNPGSISRSDKIKIVYRFY